MALLTPAEQRALKGWLDWAERAQGFDESWIQEAFERFRLNDHQRILSRIAFAAILKLWSKPC